MRDKLKAIYYVLRGWGVICNCNIRGDTVVGDHGKLYVGGQTNICPPDPRPPKGCTNEAPEYAR